MATSTKVSVLFVCMGNICRSPSGESVFQHYVEKEGYADQFFIDSAGTIIYHEGKSADARMHEVAGRRGYQLNSLARKVIKQDLVSFDLVVAMDMDNLMDLESMAGGAKQHIRLLGTFLLDSTAKHDAPAVPDPYYGGSVGFEQVLDMIESACPMILSHCLGLLNKNK